MKYREKGIKLFFRVIFVVFGLWIVGILLPLIFIFFEEYLPCTKTKFKSYEEFRARTHNFYPDEQPTSAKDIMYYYYEGKFDEFYAVAFTVDDYEFTKLKERYIEFFNPYEDYSGDGYVWYEDQIIPENFIQDENLDFLNEMLDGKFSDHKIVRYVGSGNSETKTMMGVIGNECTGELIIFDCRDAFPK